MKETIIYINRKVQKREAIEAYNKALKEMKRLGLLK